MKRFLLVRDRDLSGVSGTGVIAEGVLSSVRKVALFWVTKHRSVVLYDSLQEMIAIHGHGGATRIEWQDATPLEYPAFREASNAQDSDAVCSDNGRPGPPDRAGY